MKKIIAVAVPKGGVGKTTTAVNLAASLAVAEKKTLLIDFDPSGSCTIYMGFTPEMIKGDMFNVFSYAKSITQVIHKTDLPNLDFIPSNVTSNEVEERLERLTRNAYLFSNILSMEELNCYEYIIIDCPHYIKGLTTIALAAANSILIPVKAGKFSISALKKMVSYITSIRNTVNARLKIEGILLTMYESHTKAQSMTNEELFNNFNGYLFKTVIPKNIAITESEFFGKPSILFNAKAKGSLAYLNLAQEIIEKDSALPPVI
ncbi:MAG: ParA family protein [Ignavibacteriales bacterium]|nr:MAG: ParA family protein [Ignavibacteriales bacterium]